MSDGNRSQRGESPGAVLCPATGEPVYAATYLARLTDFFERAERL